MNTAESFKERLRTRACQRWISTKEEKEEGEEEEEEEKKKEEKEGRRFINVVMPSGLLIGIYLGNKQSYQNLGTRSGFVK